MTTQLTPAFSQKFADWLGFKTFGDPQLEKAVTGAREWYLAYSGARSPRWLSIVGTSGSGKTHICSRLWKHCKVKSDFSDASYVPHKIYWPDFMQCLRAGEGYELRNDLKSWPVLFLDDIGAERDKSGYATEELNTLLGCRMGKWTMLTSNLSFDAIAALDGRISSRLVRGNNICIGLNTKDYASRPQTPA